MLRTHSVNPLVNLLRKCPMALSVHRHHNKRQLLPNRGCNRTLYHPSARNQYNSKRTGSPIMPMHQTDHLHHKAMASRPGSNPDLAVAHSHPQLQTSTLTQRVMPVANSRRGKVNPSALSTASLASVTPITADGKGFGFRTASRHSANQTRLEKPL